MEEQTNEVSEQTFRPRYSDYMLKIAHSVNDKYLESYLSLRNGNRSWRDSWGKDSWASDWSGDGVPWRDSWNKSPNG